jgi:hypothetical protein
VEILACNRIYSNIGITGPDAGSMRRKRTSGSNFPVLYIQYLGSSLKVYKYFAPHFVKRTKSREENQKCALHNVTNETFEKVESG